ncbi:hypothetical protein ES705_18485 [subsurface metagenome]
MRDKLLEILSRLHARQPWRMLLLVLIITIVFCVFASKLEQTMRWSDMLPKGHQSTIQFEKVLDEFKSASNTVILVEGEEEKIKKFAEEAVPLIKDLKDPSDGVPYASRVDYKAETNFIKKHGLKLVKEDDLKNLKDIFENPNILPLLTNINNSFEKEYIQREESLSTREKEEGAFSFLDGIQNLIMTLHSFVSGENVGKEKIENAADRILVGEEYMLSYEKDALIILVVPNFSMMDMGKVVQGTDAIQDVINKLMAKYDGIRAGLTGMIPIQRDETVSINKSLGYTTIIALIAILALLIYAFRMWAAPVYGLITLIIGVIWSVGLTAITVGSLNMMTSIMAVILLGLGIDFSIHIISGFTENRSLGSGIEESLNKTFKNTGKGIITGAMTTAVAFFAMMIARTRGMKEMGIVLGGGVIVVMLATFLCLPALLVLKEKRKEKKLMEKGKSVRVKDISLKSLGNTANVLGARYKRTAIIAVLLTLVLAFAGSKITFDHNYLNMEPKGLESVELLDVIIDKFDLSIDYGMILAESIDESREIADKIKDKPLIAAVEDISRYLPSVEDQKKRLTFIKDINEELRKSRIDKSFTKAQLPSFIKELERLEMNIMEMQDMAYLGGQDKIDKKSTLITGDPDAEHPHNIIRDFIRLLEQNKTKSASGLGKFQKVFSPYFKKTVLNMSSEDIIKLKDLPDSILDRYANDTRNLFMVTVYPKHNIWKDKKIMAKFAENLEDTSPKATGMAIIMKYLIGFMGEDGRKALLLTIIVVFFLLWFDFGKPRYALIAMVPLLLGSIWMVGIMKLVGMQFTLMNVMGLPLIIGIGIDDGVHVVHRWLVEGKGKVREIFASTGKAILLTTVTTMLAFGSLMFSIYRGFGSLGGAMFIGVGACFLTTVIILSAIIGLIEKRKGTIL